MFLVENKNDGSQFLCKMYLGDEDLRSMEEAFELTDNLVNVSRHLFTIYEYVGEGTDPSHQFVFLTTHRDVRWFRDVVNANTPSFTLRFILQTVALTVWRLQSRGIADIQLSVFNTFINNGREVIVTGVTDATIGDDKSAMCRTFGNFVGEMLIFCDIPFSQELILLRQACARARDMQEIVDLLNSPRN